MTIDGITIIDNVGLDHGEIAAQLAIERHTFAQNGKALASVEFSADDEGYLVIKSVEKSPIRRLRRITGYLSNMENFNDAKQAELAARYKHM